MRDASRVERDWASIRAVMIAELLDRLPPRIDLTELVELLAVSTDVVRLGFLEGTLVCESDVVDSARSRLFFDRECSDRLPLPAYLRPHGEFLTSPTPTRTSPTRGSAP